MQVFKNYLLDIYRNDKYHSLRKSTKKFPLPMSGEEGIEHRTMSGFCVLNYITRYSFVKSSSVNGTSEIR